MTDPETSKTTSDVSAIKSGQVGVYETEANSAAMKNDHAGDDNSNVPEQPEPKSKDHSGKSASEKVSGISAKSETSKTIEPPEKFPVNNAEVYGPVDNDGSGNKSKKEGHQGAGEEEEKSKPSPLEKDSKENGGVKMAIPENKVIGNDPRKDNCDVAERKPQMETEDAKTIADDTIKCDSSTQNGETDPSGKEETPCGHIEKVSITSSKQDASGVIDDDKKGGEKDKTKNSSSALEAKAKELKPGISLSTTEQLKKVNEQGDKSLKAKLPGGDNKQSVQELAKVPARTESEIAIKTERPKAGNTLKKESSKNQDAKATRVEGIVSTTNATNDTKTELRENNIEEEISPPAPFQSNHLKEDDMKEIKHIHHEGCGCYDAAQEEDHEPTLDDLARLEIQGFRISALSGDLEVLGRKAKLWPPDDDDLDMAAALRQVQEEEFNDMGNEPWGNDGQEGGNESFSNLGEKALVEFEPDDDHKYPDLAKQHAVAARMTSNEWRSTGTSNHKDPKVSEKTDLNHDSKRKIADTKSIQVGDEKLVPKPEFETYSTYNPESVATMMNSDTSLSEIKRGILHKTNERHLSKEDGKGSPKSTDKFQNQENVPRILRRAVSSKQNLFK